MEQKSLPASLAQRFDETEEKLRAMLKAYEEPLRRLDSTLLEALEGAERKILHQFEQLQRQGGPRREFPFGSSRPPRTHPLDSLYPERRIAGAHALRSCLRLLRSVWSFSTS